MKPGDRVKVMFEADYVRTNSLGDHAFKTSDGVLWFSPTAMEGTEVEVLAPPPEYPVGTTIIEQNFVKGGKDRLMQIVYVRKTDGWVVFYSSDYISFDAKAAEASWPAIVKDMEVAKRMGWTVTVVEPKDAEEWV